MATTHTVQKLLTKAGKFVVEQKGSWEHAEWELFLADAEKLGLELTDEGKRNLGNVLEAAKYVYHAAPAAKKKTAKKKTAAKKKPAAKKKTAAKKKAAAKK